ETLPPGRYECVLTALDAKNRQRALHRWINVVDDGSSQEKLLAGAEPEAGAAAPAAAGAPAAAPAVSASAGIEAPKTPGQPGARVPVTAPSADLGGAMTPLVSGVSPSAPPAIAPSAEIKPGRKLKRRPVV